MKGAIVRDAETYGAEINIIETTAVAGFIRRGKQNSWRSGAAAWREDRNSWRSGAAVVASCGAQKRKFWFCTGLHRCAARCV